MIAVHLRNANGTRFSVATFLNRLRSAGLKAHRPYVVVGRLNAPPYCDEIIIPIVIPVLQTGRADILQQDNTRCHVARHTMFGPFIAEQHSDT